MTVKYTQKVANQRGFGSFTKLLMRWRGSVYKMVWQDMAVYLVLYYFLSLIYRFALPQHHRGVFETIVLNCARFRDLIPVSFVLGFYVSLVVNRWWGTYKSIPWPDSTALLLATHLQGKDQETKEQRLTIIRYVNLAIAITFSMVSPAVTRKLPTLQHFVVAGYLNENEMQLLLDLEKKSKVHKAWIPVMWATRMVEKARQDGRIRSDVIETKIINEIDNVRAKCGCILGWNDNNIPLVYTQVVTIAVYSFFGSSLLGEQYLDPSKDLKGHEIDLYIPMFALLQLFFYIGWVKVAEALLNPFGDDDHDFEFIPLLERHREMSYMLCDAVDSPASIRDADRSSLQKKDDQQTSPTFGMVPNAGASSENTGASSESAGASSENSVLIPDGNAV
ncbi:bestrophin-3-like [Palaemon carinicauda]|uniref:bestrophin-3-like n=1 Tax=Palaemon carinicauda TaxID=392227 RepID=UPI0035B67AC3